MKSELKKELELRGTAEIVNGKVCQVTQAIGEAETEVEFLLFGELKRQGIIPIDEACAKCDFWKGKFINTNLCQEHQKGDAEMRGFNQLICPKQFVDG